MTKRKVLSILTSVVCASSAFAGLSAINVGAARYSSEMTSGNFLYKKVDVNYDNTYDYIEITGWTSNSGEKVETLTIPTVIDNLSVQSIESNVFYDNKDLYEINVNSSNEYFSTLNGVLFNKDKSELICYPAGRKVSTNYEIPGVVKHIGIGAFYNCSVLENVVIPTSVDSIGDSAFYNCSSLEDIDIPRNVSSVGANAFKGTAMLNYQIANAGPLYYADTWVIGSTSGIETIIDGSTPIKSGTTGIADNTFRGCTKLSNVAIPNTVKYIGDSAFENCGELAIITIPSSVESIGGYAFSNCSRLTTMDIPNNVKNMGNGVFYNCTKLSEIKLSTSLGAIGISAFEGCKLLTAVDIPASVASIGDKAFYGCSGLNTITINNAKCEIYDSGNTINKTPITICGAKGSTAEGYATKYNKTFKEVSSSGVKGDANGDGVLRASDAAFIAKKLAEASISGSKVTITAYPNADFNGDGKITAADAAAIAKYLAEQSIKK